MSIPVTIGIPFRNAETTLGDAIRSVLLQSFKDWELILVDDGSTDDSWAVAKTFRDSRIRMIRHGRNNGLAFSLNEIARMATGAYLARMDADDIMHPERIRLQVARMDQADSPDLVSSAMFIIDERGRVTGKRRSTTPPTRSAEILKGAGLAHPTVMGTTSWFRYNPYNVHLKRTEDFELWVRTLDNTRHIYIDRRLLFYRESSFLIRDHYLRALREQRWILGRYGPELLGRRSMTLILAKLWARELVARSAHRVGQDSLLVKRRNTCLNPEELKYARQVLETLRHPAP